MLPLTSIALVLGVAFLAPQYVQAHSYSLGTCPMVEPATDFKMDRMLGIWYVIQKTSTGSSCIIYNFTRLPEPDEYQIEQISQHFALGLTPLEHEYHYTGHLTVKDPSVPAKMTVRFPLSVAGSAAYTVVMSDYENYAAIFTCQKLAFAHRQSTTILSRQKTLDKLYVDKIRQRLASFNIDPYELSIISQKNCPTKNESAVNIGIDGETFSPKSIGNVFKKAGEKIGEGVEYISEGAKKVYHKVTDDDDVPQPANVRPDSGKYVTMNPQAEWLP